MLEVVGLSACADAVYRALVEGPPATRGQLTRALRTDPEQLAAALQDLEAHGLISRLPGAPSRYTAVPPEVALEVLFLEREEELKRARIEAARLAESFLRAPGRDPAELVEVVTGPTAVLQRLEQIQRSTRKVYMGLDRPPYAQQPARCEASNLRIHDRGVTVRAIYDQHALDTPGRLEQLEELMALGEQSRVLSHVPVKLVIADERVAFLPLQANPTTIESAVVVHPSALLRALIALFEALWVQALPLSTLIAGGPAGPAGPAGDSELSSEARRILTLMTAGFADDAIARQMDTSAKTVQRRIHTIMARLGASTRFQTGVRAAFQGWIPNPAGGDTGGDTRDTGPDTGRPPAR